MALQSPKSRIQDLSCAMKANLIRDRSYAFALQIIGLYKELKQAGESVLARQLLRSGTSIGANVEEALAGQSRADFLHKMSVASKEARETSYWLRLLRDSRTVAEERIGPLFEESQRLVNIVSSIVKTTAGSKEKE